MLVLMMLLLTDLFGVRYVSRISHQLIDGSQGLAGRVSQGDYSRPSKNKPPLTHRVQASRNESTHLNPLSGQFCLPRAMPIRPNSRRLIFLGLFLLLSLLGVSAHELAIGVHADSHFLPVLVHDRVVAFLAFPSLLGDANNLIVPRFLLDGGLCLGRQILHIYRSFLLALCCQSDEETGANG